MRAAVIVMRHAWPMKLSNSACVKGRFGVQG